MNVIYLDCGLCLKVVVKKKAYKNFFQASFCPLLN